MTPTIAFRADGNDTIATGHIMRCLTIATVLRDTGWRCVFVSKAHPKSYAHLARQSGFEVIEITPGTPQTGRFPHQAWAQGSVEDDGEQCGHIPVDIWFVDHYGLDKAWSQALRRTNPAAGIVVYDDTMDREIEADALLDPNPRDKDVCAHWGHLAPTTPLYQGLAYYPLNPALLRPLSPIKARVARVLINFSGHDRWNATGKTLDVLKDWRGDIVAITSPQSPNFSEWKTQAGKNVTFCHGLDPKDMGGLYQNCDLAIGGAGIAAWERTAAGLPSIVTCLADNQKNTYDYLVSQGIAMGVPNPANPYFKSRLETTFQALHHQSVRASMRKSGLSLIDGQGLTRIVDVISRVSKHRS